MCAKACSAASVLHRSAVLCFDCFSHLFCACFHRFDGRNTVSTLTATAIFNSASKRPFFSCFFLVLLVCVCFCCTDIVKNG